jgi:hypothetical protein
MTNRFLFRRSLEAARYRGVGTTILVAAACVYSGLVASPLIVLAHR